MKHKVYAALDAIHRGAITSLPDPEPWLKALHTVGWSAGSPQAPTLTSAGRQALAEIRRGRRSEACERPSEDGASLAL